MSAPSDDPAPTTVPAPGGDLARRSGLDFLRGMIDGSTPVPPFVAVADVTPSSIEEGRVAFSGVPSSRFNNPMGIVHGGWISLLLDTVMGCAVHSALPAGKAYATIEMTTTFVRAVREGDGPLTAEGTLLHLGGRLASAEGKVYDAKRRLVAHGTESCMIWSLVGEQSKGPAATSDVRKA